MSSVASGDCRPVSLREASKLLQSLAHPVRLQLLLALRDIGMSVWYLEEELGLPQPIVSKHLAILRKAGVVRMERVGRERIYFTADACALRILKALCESKQIERQTA